MSILGVVKSKGKSHARFARWEVPAREDTYPKSHRLSEIGCPVPFNWAELPGNLSPRPQPQFEAGPL